MTATATATGRSPFSIPPMTTPQERLAALEGDVNLRHSAARWRAHAEVFPGSGADGLDSSPTADAVQAAQVSIALDEFQEKLPEGDEATLYLEWLLSVLHPDATA